tara:strand:+ start:1815 stop:2006 length:192 start_codon:yes stop_codon:yes gene_type:complete
MKICSLCAKRFSDDVDEQYEHLESEHEVEEENRIGCRYPQDWFLTEKQYKKDIKHFKDLEESK